MSGYTTQGLASFQAIVNDGASASLKKADGSDFAGNPLTALAHNDAHVLTEMRLPTNETVLKDEQSSININQFDNSGFFAGQVNVAANEPNIKLANATTRIIVNAGPCQVSDPSGKTVGAVFGVDQGALTPVELSASGDAIVSNGQQLAGVAPSGTYVDTVTFTIANGLITAITLS